MNQRFIGLFSASLVFFFANYYTSTIALSLPSIAKSYHISMHASSMVLTIYLLSWGMFVMFGGVLGDFFDKRKILVGGFVFLILASLLSCVAWGSGLLIFANAMLGLGAGLLWPNATSILFNDQEGDKVKAMGLLTFIVAVSCIFSPFIAGVLIKISTWRTVYGVGIPFFMAAALLLCFLCYKEKISENKMVFEFKKLFLLSFLPFLGFFLYEALTHIMSLDRFFTYLALLIVTSFVFYFSQVLLKHELLNFKMFKNKAFIFPAMLYMFTMGLFVITLYLMNLFLQEILNFSPLVSSLFVVAMMSAFAFFSIIAHRISRFVNKKKLLSSCFLILFVAMLVFYYATRLELAWLLAVAILLFGSVLGLSSPILISSALSTVSKDKVSSASGLYFTFNLVGGAVSLPVIKAIIASGFFKSIAKLKMSMLLRQGVLKEGLLSSQYTHANVFLMKEIKMLYLLSLSKAIAVMAVAALFICAFFTLFIKIDG